MSYDLYFRSRSPGKTISQNQFTQYFSGRKHYEVKQIQAWYSNENTGVYFSMDFMERGETSEERRDGSLLPVSFNMNYFRPHVFGLEAEPEVAAFIEHFNLTVFDPQDSGMDDGEYSKEGFLSAWNAGNEFGYGAMLSQEPGTKVMTLPSHVIEANWRWNYEIENRMKEIEVDAFVPTIFYFEIDGILQSSVVWGDGLPILLPKVNLVLAPRDRLRPRKLFGNSKQDMIVFSWKELESTLKKYSVLEGNPISYQLFYDKTPPEIESLFRSKQPPAQKPKGVPVDQVLDEELVSQYRRAKNP